MKTNDYNNDDKYLKAKKRVESIKGFYWHLAVYIIINGIITISKITRNISNGDSLYDALFDIGTIFIWIPWGIGVLIHGLVVFEVFKFLLGKNWEERKIKELMEKDDAEFRSLK